MVKLARVRMNGKVVMSTISLLFVAMIAISPVMAINACVRPHASEQPYWEHCVVAPSGNPSKVWVSGSIMHIMDLPFSGSYVGTLGTGTIVINFAQIIVNTATGEGTCQGTWTVFIGEDTLSGSANGKITGGLTGTNEGYFRGTQGTDAFKGIQKMGTYVVNLATGILDAEGVIIYH
jgi:hypothetical protein